MEGLLWLGLQVIRLVSALLGVGIIVVIGEGIINGIQVVGSAEFSILHILLDRPVESLWVVFYMGAWIGLILASIMITTYLIRVMRAIDGTVATKANPICKGNVVRFRRIGYAVIVFTIADFVINLGYESALSIKEENDLAV